MEKYVMALLTVLACLLFAALAIRAWKSRAARQTSLFLSPLEKLTSKGQPVAIADAFYVATTFANNFLERIAAHGLGARGFSQIQVFAEGVLVSRIGERDLAIVRDDLISVSYSQVAIDKAVESDGLMVLSWRAGETMLATHLRIKDLSSRSLIFRTLSDLVPGGVKK
jgi:hypothetical protein